ncbi:hypothetical protein DFH06DRAFT_582946 [Mycena polygramma]|nr:hypothetical protein DFH06DRAFT_582946 [Mycena polygramma]
MLIVDANFFMWMTTCLVAITRSAAVISFSGRLSFFPSFSVRFVLVLPLPPRITRSLAVARLSDATPRLPHVVQCTHTHSTHESAISFISDPARATSVRAFRAVRGRELPVLSPSQTADYTQLSHPTANSGRRRSESTGSLLLGCLGFTRLFGYSLFVRPLRSLEALHIGHRYRSLFSVAPLLFPVAPSSSPSACQPTASATLVLSSWRVLTYFYCVYCVYTALILIPGIVYCVCGQGRDASSVCTRCLFRAVLALALVSIMIP